jgi:hypothetical protein
MKEIFEAVSARIKAPYFGYAVLAFLALNWRAIFLLIVTQATPAARLEAFDKATDPARLYLYPLLVGAAVTVVTPWVRYIFIRISKKPYSLLDGINLEAEHTNNLKKTELERSRAAFFAAKEQALIDQAKRDAEVRTIGDEQVKKEVVERIETLRQERNAAHSIDTPSTPTLSKEERELLLRAAMDPKGQIMRMRDSHGPIIAVADTAFGRGSKHAYLEYDEALKSLISKRLVRAVTGDAVFELTLSGWRTAKAENPNLS